MKTIAKNSGVLIAIAVFILAMFIYNMFFKSETATVTDNLSVTTVGDDLIKLRGELQKVTLDRTIFSSKSYLYLNDYSVQIIQQATGRSNPFDIIGRD